MLNKIIKVDIRSRKWSIRIVPRHLMPVEGADGFCHEHRCAIDIVDDLEPQAMKIVLTHELTHAFLTMAGCFEENAFKQEYVCDFVAWNVDELIKTRDEVLEELQ